MYHSIKGNHRYVSEHLYLLQSNSIIVMMINMVGNRRLSQLHISSIILVTTNMAGKRRLLPFFFFNDRRGNIFWNIFTSYRIIVLFMKMTNVVGKRRLLQNNIALFYWWRSWSMVMFQNTFQLEGDVLIGEHIFHGVSTTSRRYVKDGRLVIVSGYPPPPFFFFLLLYNCIVPLRFFP